MRNIWLLIVCQFLCGIAQAMPCDSVFSCTDIDNPKTCIRQLEMILPTHEKQNKECLPYLYKKLAYYYELSYQWDEAIFYYTLASEGYARSKNEQEQAQCINLRGIAKENNLDYPEAIKDYYEALVIFERLNNDKGIGNAYLNIGLIYHYQEKHDVARYNFLKALQAFLKCNHGMGKSAAFNSLGMHYHKIGEPETAILYYLATLRNDYLIQAPELELSYTLNNIGDTYETLNQPLKALYYYHLSLSKKVKSNNQNGIAGAFNNIASAHISLKNYDSALYYLQRADALNEQYEFKDRAVETNRNLYELNKNLGNYEKALYYFQKFHVGKDSVINSENDIEIQKIKNNYELKITRTQLSEQAILLHTERQQKIYISVALIICTLTLAYAFYISRIRKRLLKSLHKKNDEIRQQIIEIRQTEEKAKQASKAKSQFLSMMSHEIRTPLNAINSVVYLLDQQHVNSEQQKQIQILKSATQHLVSLVDDILDLSKIESGKLRMEMIPFQIKQMCLNLQDLFETKALEKKLEFRFHMDQQVPEWVIGDQVRISQVLVNLLSNAIKFTHTGFISFRIISTDTMGDYARILFEVADSGIGIDEKQQKRIFKTFEQADDSTTRKYGGTGLGLSISKHIVELMGSHILLKSKSGEGSVFSFELILKKVNTTHTAPPDNIQSEDKKLSASILLVEDNELSAYVVGQVFRQWGADLITAKSGAEAIAKVAQVVPDIIFMDLHMDDMSGFDAAVIIHNQFPNIPIIAFTASTMAEDLMLKVHDSPMKEIIFKPFVPHELLAVTQKYLNP